MNPTAQDDDQDMLADSARRYAERGYTASQRAASLASPHGCAGARWAELADMGWLALPLPDSHGGLGGSLADVCRLAEALGPALLVEPWLACGVVSAGLLARCGTPAQRDDWLPSLASGQRRVAWAAWDAGSRFDALRIGTRAVPEAAGYRLHGRKELVLGAGGADALLVSAMCPADALGGSQPDEAAALFLVPSDSPGLSLQPYALIDGRHAAHLALDGVWVPASARLDGAGSDAAPAIAQARDEALVAFSAEAVGAMARALQITLDYLKLRKQFGRVLASNQALQHRLVDMHVAITEARALVMAAAQASDTTPGQRQANAAAAKAYASQAARLVWEESVQMHGAIGMTDAYELGAYVKHLAAFCQLLGDADHHLDHLAGHSLGPVA